MQVYFYTNKEKFIELFEWIKKEFLNIRYFDNTKNCLLDETEIYNGEPGYSKHIFLTDEYSTLYSKVRDNNSYDFPEEKYPLIFQNGIELLLGYSENKIYNFDFTNYNPYDKANHEKFYRCKFYGDSYYLENNELYVKMYQKICRKIRKNSTKINGKYYGFYWLYGKLK